MPETMQERQPGRRRRRREDTIREILTIATELMADHGVAALSLSDIARRLGIQPPSLFRYVPSKLALYDALFAEGARQVLAAFRSAAAEAEPGLPALRAGLTALARFVLANPVFGQLLFWRPVPGFTPSPASFRPAEDFVAAVRAVLRDAAGRGHLHPDAASEEGHALLSVLFAGALTQQLANEPGAALEDGRFTRLLPRLISMFAAAYPPPGEPPP